MIYSVQATTMAPDSSLRIGSQCPGPGTSKSAKPRLGNLKLAMDLLNPMDSDENDTEPRTPIRTKDAKQRLLATNEVEVSPRSSVSELSKDSVLFDINHSYTTPDSSPPTPSSIHTHISRTKRSRAAETANQDQLVEPARPIANVGRALATTPADSDPVAVRRRPQSKSPGGRPLNDEIALRLLRTAGGAEEGSPAPKESSGPPPGPFVHISSPASRDAKRPSAWMSLYAQVYPAMQEYSKTLQQDTVTSVDLNDTVQSSVDPKAHHSLLTDTHAPDVQPAIPGPLVHEYAQSRGFATQGTIQPIVSAAEVSNKVKEARERMRRYAEEAESTKALIKQAKMESLLRKIQHDSVEPADVHIFVDMSNINISFQNIADMKQVVNTANPSRPLELSFEHLKLIMERRRSDHVKTRFVAGSVKFVGQKTDSTKRALHFQEAEAAGYEVKVLVRVPAAPKTSVRKSHRKRRGGLTTTDDSSSGGESGLGAQQRNGEQGVDELLHLRILECVTDSPTSPGVIVLATGDANAAEFSKGFAHYISKALEHGWHVELVTWKHSMSAEWRRSPFCDHFRERFRIVLLDEFFDELHADWI